MLSIAEIPSYETCKESGVDWLGAIPSDWNVKPGMVAFTESKRDNKGMKESRVLSLSYGRIIVKPEEKLVGLVPESFETYQLVDPGDIIVRCTDLQNDQTSLRTGLAKDKGIITSANLNLKVNQGYDARYMHYYLHALDASKVLYKFGTGLRQNLSFFDFKRLPVLDIPLQWQVDIAKFLDKKTTQIDEAIAIKEQQIALLKERKQIIIQKSVTQGLDPTVPMKDSGVDWIGKIPAHWEVKQLKHLLSEPLKYGANESGVDYQPELPRYIRITDFSGDGQLSDEKKLSLPWRVGREYLLGDSDILLARSGATVGKSYQFKKSMSNESSHCFAGYLIKATADNSKMISDYLYLYLGSDCFTAWKSLIFNKATIENIGADKYASLFVVVPPLSEQKEILGLVREKLNPISLSIDTFLDQIRKLKEYKTTLINSAVTGKIRITPDMVEA